MAYNDTDAISKCMEYVLDKLKPNGIFIGIDWPSTMDDTYINNEPKHTDKYTISNVKDRSGADIGETHYSDRDHLLYLFRDFEIIVLEHKIINKEIPSNGNNRAFWNFVAKKETERG